MSNFDQYNRVGNPSIVLIGGDAFNFYVNLNDPVSDLSFSNRLDLVMEVGDGFALVAQDVATVNRDFVDGTNHNFYASFTVPFDLTEGCYRLIIVNASAELVRFVSRSMIYQSTTDYTLPIRYRNNLDILNYGYVALSSFYNTFRLALMKRQVLKQINQNGYDLIDGSFYPVRTVMGRTEEFILIWANEFMHESFEAATIHSNFEIGTKTGWSQYVRKDEYQVDWNEDYPLADGSIRLEQKSTFNSNKII